MGRAYAVQPEELRVLAQRLEEIRTDLEESDDRDDFSLHDFGDGRLVNGLADFASAWRDGRKRINTAINDISTRLNDAAQYYLETEGEIAGWSTALLAPPGGERHVSAVQPGRAGFTTEADRAAAARDAEITRLKADIARLKREPFAEQTNAAQIRSLQARLHKIEALGPPMQLLGFSASNGEDHVVQVHGDLSRASRVVIIVPGMATDFGDYGPGGGQTKNADNLYRQLRKTYGDEVAVVAWCDYDSPKGVLDAAEPGGANRGAPNLKAFVDSLHSNGFGTNDISIVAHSYGTLVTGRAMQRGLDVSRVVAIGSPGMGSSTRAGLGSPGVQLYAAQSYDDPISLVDPTNRFGPDPATAGFGNAFDVGNVDGHSQYFTPGSTSLTNIASLSVGHAPVPAPAVVSLVDKALP
jgi:pimeloyl-ACP methyl ester carboxylesterase